MATQIIEKKRTDGSLIYYLDRDKKKGEYHVNPGSSQTKFIREISLDGFSTFPKTLYPTGFGFKVSGTYLLNPLRDKYGSRLRIILSASRPSSITKLKNIVRVTINEPALIQVNRFVSDVKRKRGNEISTLVNDFLGQEFPKSFKGLSKGLLKYHPNTIADLLSDQNVISTLSDKDKDA